jgi:hypothetical protein
MRQLASVLTAAMAVTVASSAHAEDTLAPRVLVLPFEGKGPPVPARVSQVIVRVAGERGARVSMAETGLTETSLLVGCDPAEAACLDAMASALNVDHLVFGTVQRRGKGALVQLTVTARQRTPARVTVELPDVRTDPRSEERVAAEVARILAAFELEARAAAAEPTPAPAAPATSALAPTPEDAAPPPAAARGGVRFWTWTLIAGGAAMAAGGGALWGIALAERGDLADAPTETAAELEDLRDREDGVELKLRLGGGLAIAGAAVAVTGVVFALRQRGGAAETSSIGVSAVPLPGGGAVGLAGRF